MRNARLIHSDADGQTSARWLPLHRWRGDGHRGPAFPAQPQPGNNGPFLTKMLVSMAFAIWFMFRYCASALPPCGGNRLPVSPPRNGIRHVGDAHDGQHRHHQSVTANGCSAVVSTNSSRVCSEL